MWGDCLLLRALGKAQPGFIGTFLGKWEAAGLRGGEVLGPYPSPGVDTTLDP